MKQEEALKIMESGYNIFLTGPPGSGKTWVLEEFIKRVNNTLKVCAITASTGIAATHIGGKTIHSWSGIGILPEHRLNRDEELEKIANKKYIKKEISKTDILILDEISMFSNYQLDAVNKICQLVHKNTFPFGGIQVILSGDFFQLPPVSTNNKANYAFDSQSWKTMNLVVCYLTDIFRQRDKKFIDALLNIRSGNITEETISLFKNRINATIKVKEGMKAVKLLPTNNKVDKINYFELSKLQSKQKFYTMKKSGNDTRLIETLVKTCLSPENLELKIGAMVMFTKNNFKQGYVNGTLGKVTGFTKPCNSCDYNEICEFNHNTSLCGEDTIKFIEFPIVETTSGDNIIVKHETWELARSFIDKNTKNDTTVSITQIPLRLAWAITIHKSQGMSLDYAEMDLSQLFSDGMGYVAVSRVRDLLGLTLLDFDDEALTVDPYVIEKDKDFREDSKKFDITS